MSQSQHLKVTEAKIQSTLNSQESKPQPGQCWRHAQLIRLIRQEHF